MTNLSQEQEEMRQSIQKSAMIWSIVFALITVAILFFALASQGALVRFGASAVAGIAVLVGIFKWRFAANSQSAQCESCSAAFSISKTDHVETQKSSTAKEEREEQEDKSTKVTTWNEEVFDVVDTYTCANCNAVKTKEYTTTRKADEKSEVEPAPKKPSDKTRGRPKAKAADKDAKPARSRPKTKAEKPVDEQAAPKPAARSRPKPKDS